MCHPKARLSLFGRVKACAPEGDENGLFSFPRMKGFANWIMYGNLNIDSVIVKATFDL